MEDLNENTHHKKIYNCLLTKLQGGNRVQVLKEQKCLKTQNT